MHTRNMYSFLHASHLFHSIITHHMYIGLLLVTVNTLLCVVSQYVVVFISILYCPTHAIMGGNACILHICIHTRAHACARTHTHTYTHTVTATGNDHLIACAVCQSVTAFGRMMIDQSRQLVEEKFCTKNGYKHNAKVSLQLL